MKKKFNKIIISVFVVLSSLCYVNIILAQNELTTELLNYYKNTSKARFFYHNKEYDSCNYYLSNAFKIGSVKPLFQDEFCLSLSYACKNKYDSSFKYLIKSINKSPSLIFYTEYIQMDKDSFSIKDSKYKFIEYSSKYYKELYSIYNLKKEMYKISNSFNLLRDSARYFLANDMLYSETNKKYASNERYKDVLDYNLENRDNYEKKLVDFIVRNNCIISVNNYGNETFFQCLIHLSTKNLEKILPIIIKEAQTANISPYVFGAVLERIYKNENLDSCAGYNIMHTSYCNEADWSKIISNRNSIGLNNYLTEDDYSLNAFSKIYRKRVIQPWINILDN